MTARLSGVRVVEIGALSAGAYAARLFADFGAEVIKVEPAGGDPTRSFPPLIQGGSGWFAYLNYGKKSVLADKVDLDALLRGADVLIDFTGTDHGTHPASRYRRSLLVRQVRPLPRFQGQRCRLPRARGFRAVDRPRRRPAAHLARLPVGDHGRTGRLHPGDGLAARPAKPPLRGERARGHHRARRVPGHRSMGDRHAAEALGFQPLHADLSDGRLSLQARLDRHHHRDPGAVEVVLRSVGHAGPRPPSAVRHGWRAAGPRRRTGSPLRAALPRPHGRGMVCIRARATPALRHRAKHGRCAALAGVPRPQGHRAHQDGRQDSRSARLTVSSDAHAA